MSQSRTAERRLARLEELRHEEEVRQASAELGDRGRCWVVVRFLEGETKELAIQRTLSQPEYSWVNELSVAARGRLLFLIVMRGRRNRQ